MQMNRLLPMLGFARVVWTQMNKLVQYDPLMKVKHGKGASVVCLCKCTCSMRPRLSFVEGEWARE